MKLSELSNIITEVHRTLQKQANNAVNQGLTMRNWLVGFYIVHYQQNGEERAKYGSELLKVLAKQINKKGFTPSDLSKYRLFYKNYPRLVKTLPNSLQPIIRQFPILGTVFPKLETTKNNNAALLQKLSFSHFAELIKIDNVMSIIITTKLKN